jgi:hypothetical protein
MNRIAVALAVLLLSSFARAQQVLTVESKWNEKTFSKTVTGVTSATFDIGGFGSAGGMVLGNTGTANGVDGTTYGATSIITSTWTNVVGFDYVFYASATLSTTFPSLQIAQTLKMPTPAGVGFNNGNQNVRSTTTYNTPYPSSYFFTVPLISTSSVITEPNGVLVQHSFRAQVQNPVFILTGLTASATYMLTVDYGVSPRQ